MSLADQIRKRKGNPLFFRKVEAYWRCMIKENKAMWIKTFSNFKEEGKGKVVTYSKMKPSEKWAELQYLRNIYSKITNSKNGKNRKRLRRVITIIQQA